MKSKDLALNAVYLVNPRKLWESDTYTGVQHHSTRRVRVLDPVPGTWVHRDGVGYVRGTGYSHQMRTGVLVAVLDPASGEWTGRNDIVATAHIRGPWVETWAAVQAAAKAVREARDERNRAVREGNQRVQEVLSRLGALAGFHTGAYVQDHSRAVVSVEVLERIADRLEDR